MWKKILSNYQSDLFHMTHLVLAHESPRKIGSSIDLLSSWGECCIPLSMDAPGCRFLSQSQFYPLFTIYTNCSLQLLVVEKAVLSWLWVAAQWRVIVSSSFLVPELGQPFVMISTQFLINFVFVYCFLRDAVPAYLGRFEL